ncbi:hypothetical protein D3C71_2098500 [compost metagenome]
MPDRVLQGVARPNPVRGGDVHPQPVKVAADSSDDPGPAARIGLVDVDRVPGDGEGLGDPMPHQPGADDSNTLLRHAFVASPLP